MKKKTKDIDSMKGWNRPTIYWDGDIDLIDILNIFLLLVAIFFVGAIIYFIVLLFLGG